MPAADPVAAADTDAAEPGKPGTAATHFARGNRLAAAKRWSSARDAYAAALASGGERAVYRYNLAVAHDRLGRRSAARHHYRAALRRAGNGPADFDTARARERLEELE